MTKQADIIRAKIRLRLSREVFEHMLIKRKEIIRETNRAEMDVMDALRELSILEGKRND